MTPDPCPARLGNRADGLHCLEVGPHRTHRYAASDVPDAHDRSEAESEATR